MRNANLQLVKVLVERLYGVSLGLYNRPKDISYLFILYPQLITYFFKILNSENLDQRAYIVFQFFLESQVDNKLLTENYSNILNCFQLVFINCIKEYDNYNGKLAVRSFVALSSIKDIPAIVYDIKVYIETNSMKTNILSNFIFLLQELYEKFQKSFHYTLNTQQINIENCLLSLAYSLKLSNLPIFYPVFYNVLLLNPNWLKVNYFKFENNYMGRIWLNNNLSFLLLNSNTCDIGSICDIVLSYKLPYFAQIKILNILLYKFEMQSFRKEDVKKILQVLFKSTMTIDDKNSFLLGSFLKVILVFGNGFPKMEIDSNIVLTTSDNLYRNMIFIIYMTFRGKGSSGKSLSKNNKFIEQQLILNIAISEEIDNDILSVLCYSQKLSLISNFNFCKLIFYFCTNESTYLYLYYIIMFYRDKNFYSILALLRDFFHPEHLSTILNQSNITKLYNNLDSALEKARISYAKCNSSFYQIEGDQLIPYSILHNLLRYLYKKMN